MACNWLISATVSMFKFIIMKNKSIWQITLMISLVWLISATAVFAQSKNETRQERKAREAKQDQMAFKKAKAAMFDTAFVVPAQTIQFRNGSLVGVNGTINYLQVIGKKGVLQIGSYLSPGPGLNNIGGVTLKGNISDLKINQKKDRVFMRFTLTGLIGTANVAVNITGSNRATVDVNGMFSGRFFTMTGNLITLKEAHVIEGSEY